MTAWKTDKLVKQIRNFTVDHPNAGRSTIADVFEISEFKAREVLRELDAEPEIPLIGPTIAYFDLETTNLLADVGRLLCGSVMSYPSMKMETYRIDDYCNGKMSEDGALAVAIRDKIEEHDISCGWYSKGFDISFLNTRLVQSGHRMLERMIHIDAIWYYRGWRGLKPRSSKMSVVAEFYNLDDRKMNVDVKVWADAMGGDKDALDELVDRCESDVIITAKLAKKAFEDRLIKNLQSYP